ncbi:IclR family transcriptional regulator [Rhodopseudomonas palustris]|uniref:IclR family transcriptional regulator n=2 Tax=Nitrobacteraceae TaxID=41294 RepID=A0A0D7EXK9_RHOPL|nr:IclR family transcriptional regulator [Rhodopseudomonas palustris]
MLGTLRLFSREKPVLSAEQIGEGAGVPTSTAYRYVKELTKAGLLVRWKGGFALGPRIMELDLQIRECDPAIIAAAGPMRELSLQSGLDVMLTKIYDRSIVTVHIESTGPGRVLNFGRGKPLPMFRGSSSKAIIAFLPAARLRRLHEEGRAAGDPDALAHDWDEFYESMQAIRKSGYCLSKGELNTGIEGMSAPIFGGDRAVIGSLTLLGDAHRMSLLREEVLIQFLQDAAASVSQALS